MIAWAATGCLLSTTLPGCTNRQAAVERAVAVKVEDTPPAELLGCPARPAPLPEDQVAIVPAALRAGLIALGIAFAANADQLARLVNWHAPGACPPEGRK